MAENYAIIVGGGSGTRMQSNTPKQFMLLNGLPILMHTIKKFKNTQSNPTVLLILNSTVKEMWQRLCREYHFTVPHTIVTGGETRFHSVLNGLQYISNHLSPQKDSYVVVHDGVRPLVPSTLIDAGLKLVKKSKALITATDSRDSIRIKEADHTNKAIDRTRVFLVQTPQFFSIEILLEAYKQPFQSIFTDDASVVENIGYPIEIMQGDTRNIKITFPEDLLLAEIMLKSSSI